jgi:ferredoxin
LLNPLIGDCASDAPLSATLRALACARADDVLLGLGALAVARKAEQLRLVVRHFDAEAALRAAVERLSAKVEIVRLPDAWPPLVDGVDARVLVAASPARKDSARYLTVAGAVRQPAVLPVRGEATLEALVSMAGGPLDDDWLPVVDHRVAARDEVWGGEPLLLALPVTHPMVRRLRTPIADWLKRAASACEGCRICSESCAHLSPHEVVWTLATLRDDGVAPVAALACTGCGLCDAMCPSALSPRALVVEVRDRLKKGGPPYVKVDIGAHESGRDPYVKVDIGGGANGLEMGLLTRRLGLADYDREPLRKL